MCSGGVDLFPLHDAHCYIDGATPKHRAAEDHLYHCMALMSTSHSFSWSRWNLLAGRRNMVLQMKEFLDKKRQVRKVQREPFVPIIMHTFYIYRCSYMHLVLLFLNICIVLKQSVEQYIFTQRRLPDRGMDNSMSDHTAKNLVLCILKKKLCTCCASAEMNCHELLRFLGQLISEISNFRFSYFHQVYPICGSYKLTISGMVCGRHFSER